MDDNQGRGNSFYVQNETGGYVNPDFNEYEGEETHGVVSLFVGNFPFDCTENDLGNAFAKFGLVTNVRVIMDRDSGQPRGFAFVEMNSMADAQAAIAGLNDKDFYGRKLRVSVTNGLFS
eukprot:TRINITY_DN22812_c0_g1_i1.p1 TRINITY_DN22812_c0_g1~~TRINITY_DN22812_c0_g1_i1.p1  ORF type:complete len:131 (-),score=22.15 TRINITY_DN22812_c0_g1_i1:190-546(-)